MGQCVCLSADTVVIMNTTSQSMNTQIKLIGVEGGKN